MICFQCNKDIEVTQENPLLDYYCLKRKSSGPVALYFHTNCFNDVAGNFYEAAIENQKKCCLLCGRGPLSMGGKVKLCASCAQGAPNCICSKQMVLRVRRGADSLFWGCSAFPSCKHTMQI